MKLFSAAGSLTVLLFILTALFFSGCASVKTENIQRIDISLLSEAGEPVSAVIPGQNYSMSLTAYLTDNTYSDKVDHTQLAIESGGFFEIIHVLKREVILRASDDTPQLAKTGKLELSVSLIENPAIKAETFYPVDWENFTVLDRSGKKGNKGMKGAVGRAGQYNSSSKTYIDGHTGDTGKPGGQGENGPAITVLASFYSSSSLSGIPGSTGRVLLLYILEEKKAVFAPEQPFTIRASGGEGGEGGAAGTFSEVKNNIRTTVTGKPGKGGDGGRGGRGGNGGSITLLYSDDNILKLVKTDVSGGKGGPGGKPGRNASAITGTGMTGNEGESGAVSSKKVTYEEALSILSSSAVVNPDQLLKP